MNFLSPKVGKQRLNGNTVGMLHRGVLKSAEAIFTGNQPSETPEEKRDKILRRAKEKLTGKFRMDDRERAMAYYKKDTGPRYKADPDDPDSLVLVSPSEKPDRMRYGGGKRKKSSSAKKLKPKSKKRSTRKNIRKKTRKQRK